MGVLLEFLDYVVGKVSFVSGFFRLGELINFIFVFVRLGWVFCYLLLRRF